MATAILLFAAETFEYLFATLVTSQETKGNVKFSWGGEQRFVYSSSFTLQITIAV
jgi:hypothetical protein